MIENLEATTVEERDAVFRFWYSVYVEEMGRYRRTADHARRELRDAEDDESFIFYARDDDDVVAACRFSWGGRGFSERQIRQYQLAPFLTELPGEHLLVGERTMVAASHRGGSVWVDLALSTTPLVERLGVLVSFGASEPHLVSLYAQFGQRPYADRQFYSEESGYLVPTVAFTRDPHDTWGPVLPGCVARALSGDCAVHNAAVDGDERFRRELERALQPVPSGDSVLRRLTDDDVRACCARGTLLRCRRGDHVVTEGGTARNPFLACSGELEARSASREPVAIRPGELFGASSWLGTSSTRDADVYVTRDGTEILALSERTLRDLPDATARKLLTNTAALLHRHLHDAGRSTG